MMTKLTVSGKLS